MTILALEPKAAGINIMQKLAANGSTSYVEGITVNSVRLNDDTIIPVNLDLMEVDSVSAKGVGFRYNKQFGILYLNKEDFNVKDVVLDVTIGTMQK